MWRSNTDDEEKKIEIPQNWHWQLCYDERKDNAVKI
jgi:hypothetical protein